MAQLVGVQSFLSSEATGKFNFYFKDDSLKLQMVEVPVEYGKFNFEGRTTVPSYTNFVKRGVSEGDWFKNLFRMYDQFPDVRGMDDSKSWLKFEVTKSHAVREDFTSEDQAVGLTYKHNESIKHIINYQMANPATDAIQNEKKLHNQYDWDELINGRYESFFKDGKKRFRHKYVINRFMVYGADAMKTKEKFYMDIKIDGSVEDYYPIGKKKKLITYQDNYVVEKKEEEKEIQFKKRFRSGSQINYYPTGKTKMEVSLNENGFDGKAVYYYEDGLTVWKEEVYKNGVKHGAFTEYYEDGTKKSEGKFDQGNLVGELTEYAPSSGNDN